MQFSPARVLVSQFWSHFFIPYTVWTRKAELNCSLLRMGIKKMSAMRLRHTKPPRREYELIV